MGSDRHLGHACCCYLFHLSGYGAVKVIDERGVIGSENAPTTAEVKEPRRNLCVLIVAGLCGGVCASLFPNRWILCRDAGCNFTCDSICCRRKRKPPKTGASWNTTRQRADRDPAGPRRAKCNSVLRVSPGTPATVMDDRQVSAILGKNVRSKDGEDMGRIVDVIVNRAGQLRAAVINFGGFLGVGSRKIAVDWGALRFGSSTQPDLVSLDLTKEQVRVAPEYKPGVPISDWARRSTPGCE